MQGGERGRFGPYEIVVAVVSVQCHGNHRREAYGQDSKCRLWLQQGHIGYVLAVPCSQKIPTDSGSARADFLAAHAPALAWKRRSCGDGVKGSRLYDFEQCGGERSATLLRYLDVIVERSEDGMWEPEPVLAAAWKLARR